MSDPFIGEIRQVGFNYEPNGWAFCRGQLMQIRSNTALFSILGTTYGGDGRTTFGLPDLQDSFVMGAGQGQGLSLQALGERGGSDRVTLTQDQMPSHQHTPLASAALGDAESPQAASWAQPRDGRVTENVYTSSVPGTTMSPQALGVAGSDQPHNNMPPYVTVNYIIALTGVFPRRP